MTSISILAEMPEPFYTIIQSFLESHPDWDWDRCIRTGMLLFLAQQEPFRLEQLYLEYNFLLEGENYLD